MKFNIFFYKFLNVYFSVDLINLNFLYMRKFIENFGIIGYLILENILFYFNSMYM